MSALVCAVILVAFLMPFASGCWDSIDIEDRSFVAVAALEPAEGGENKGVSVSILIPIPGGVQGGANGGGRGNGQDNAQKSVVIKENGLYIEDAVDKMRAKFGGVIDFSSLQFIAIGKDVDPEDMWKGLSTVLFFRYVPLTSLIFATEDDMGELLRLSPASGKRLVEVLNGLEAQSKQGLGSVRFLSVWQVMSLIRNDVGDVVLPLIGLTDGGDGIEALGTAVYDGTRRAGTLGPTDSMLLYGIAWRKHLGGTYTMHYEGREFIVRIIRMKTKTRMTGVDANGLPRVGVKLSVAARLLDSGGYRVSLVDRSRLNDLERAAERDLEDRLERILMKLKAWNSDAMRLYYALRLKTPYMSYDDFKGVYSKMEVDFAVSMSLRRAGLLK